MNPPPLPVSSVERFAEIAAALVHPFAARDAVLRDAGLDERAWSAMESRWLAVFEADPALVDRYVARYTAVAQGGSKVAAGALLVPEAPAPLLPTRSEPPPLFVVAQALPRLDMTLEPGISLRAVLPFLEGSPDPGWMTPSPSRPPADPGRVDATLDLPEGFRAMGVLPFPAAEAPRPPGGSALAETLEIGAYLPIPGRRLHRFDSKTGEPLPVPVWVDQLTDPKKTT